MPIRPENRNRYPSYWIELSLNIRFNRAKGYCEFCEAENRKPNPRTGSDVILTVAHLDHTPENNDPSNLATLCQACHFAYDRLSNIRNRQLRERGTPLFSINHTENDSVFSLSKKMKRMYQEFRSKYPKKIG